MIKHKSTISIIIALLLAASGSTAAFAQASFNGEIGLSYLNFDDEGNRASARELNDIYDGFNLQNLSAFGNLDPRTRYFVKLDEINLDGRKARFELTNLNFFRLKADYRQSRLLYGADEDSKNERKSFGGRLEITPVEALAGFLSYRNYQNEGERVVFDVANEGLFGTQYDRRSSLMEGGIKIRHLGHQLEASYGSRTYDDKINDDLDSKTTTLKFDFFGKLTPKLKLVGNFYNASKERDLSGDKLTENIFGLALMARVRPRLTVAPMFKYRTVTGEPNDPDYTSLRFGLDADYALPRNATINAAFGYETLEADTNSTRLLYYSIGARARFLEHFNARISYAGESRDDPDTLLLNGVEDKTKLLAELSWIPCAYADVIAGYKQLLRTNGDIDTKASSNSLYARMDGRYNGKGSLSLQANRADVKYDWAGEQLKYKYNSVSGSAAYSLMTDLELKVGGTYYIFDDYVQQNKLDVTFGAYYQFERARLGLSYRRYEIDEYTMASDYYQANLIKGELIVNFK